MPTWFAEVKLLLDEIHTSAIAKALPERGIDVIAVADTPSLRGYSDADLLDRAAATGRVSVTENVGDYSLLVSLRASVDKPHPGVIFASPNRFHRASLAYPGDVISALGAFLDDPPIGGESWVWWL